MKTNADFSGDGKLHQPTVSRRSSPAYVLAASVVVVLLLFRWGALRKGLWLDLDVYIRGAAAVMHHEQLYVVSVHSLPFTYTPFAALFFIPLELLGNIDARWALTATSVVAYVVVVVVCARRLRLNIASAGLVGLAGLAFEPLYRNIVLGQINVLLLALVVVDCLAIPKRYRGMLVGLAAGIKLVPGAFILFFVIKREWGAALRCLASFFATIALGGVFAPRDSWQYWSGGFMNLSRFGAAAVIGGDNQSLNGVLMRLSHDLSPSPILTFLLSVGVMALGLVAGKRQIDSGDDVAGLLCIAIASLLASPISWTHHWVWAIIALLVLVEGRHSVAASLLSAIFVIGPMWLAPHGKLLELQHNGWQEAACVSYVLVGLSLLIFFARGRRRSHEGRDPSAAEVQRVGPALVP
jgi:alpha-1,2-mannosyltransferase